MLIDEFTYRDFIDTASRSDAWMIDTETTGVGRDDVLVGIAIKPIGHASAYLPFRHRQGSNLPISYLREILDLARHIPLYGWNSSVFDASMLRREGLVWMWMFDVMYAAFLVDENQGRGSYNLVAQINKWGGDASKQREMDNILAAHLLDKSRIADLDPRHVEAYACDDVDQVEWLLNRYLPHLERQNLVDVWTGVSEYGQLMGLMCDRGVPVDIPPMEEEIGDLQRRMVECMMRARDMAKRPVTMTPKSIENWLGVSQTDQDTLEETFGSDDPRVRIIRDFRMAQKGVGSYYLPCVKQHRHGRIHPHISLIGTATGRPANWGGRGHVNLLAMPRNTEEYRFKHFVKAPDDQLLLYADYKNAEICLATHYASEAGMAEILKSGANVHRATGKRLGIDYDSAKRLNFSMIYGIQANSLSKRLKCSKENAQRHINAYNREFPGFSNFYRLAESLAQRRRYVKMWTGRRRHYTGSAFWDCHKASDHVVQGGVNELLRIKQIELHHAFSDVEQILQVYDAALMLIPEDDNHHRRATEIREVMEYHDFSVPMRVDISIGKTLGSMKEF
jgi:DNA polymerase-1